MSSFRAVSYANFISGEASIVNIRNSTSRISRETLRFVQATSLDGTKRRPHAASENGFVLTMSGREAFQRFARQLQQQSGRGGGGGSAGGVPWGGGAGLLLLVGGGLALNSALFNGWALHYIHASSSALGSGRDKTRQVILTI